MKFDRQKIYRLSRDRRFLLRAAMVIAAVSIALGLIVSLTTTRAGVLPFFARNKSADALRQIERFFQERNPGIEELAQWIRQPGRLIEPFLAEFDGFEFSEELDLEGVHEEVGRSMVSFLETAVSQSEKVDPSERKLLLDLLHGLHDDSPISAEEALESLRSASAMEPPRRFANEFLADVFSFRGDRDSAIEHYRKEVEFFGESADYSRLRVVSLLRQEGKTDELREEIANPETWRLLPANERIRVATELRDYGKLFVAIVLSDLQVGRGGLLFLSLFAGAIWFVIVTQFSGYDRVRFCWFLTAIVLGWFSATATLFVVQIQEGIRGFTLDYEDPMVRQLIYCVAGIGLREESLKLLFFIPLVPFLLRKGGEIDALVCGGLVGLGFAVNENVGYVEGFGEFTAWSRFLTANFLHIAMSGVIGLAFFRMCRWPKRQWDNFLYDFLIIVAIHGAYDALGMVPGLADYNILWLVIYALTAYLFFDHANQLMGAGSAHTVSPLAVFVIGSALLMGVIFLYACWGQPFFDALADYIASLSGMVPIAFVFINRLRDH